MYFCKQWGLCGSLVLVLLTSCSGYQGFDEICLIYTEAKAQHKTRETMSQYIFDNVAARVTSRDALEAHSVIFNLSAADRYKVFKEAAEESLKRKWECNVMQEMMVASTVK